MCIRHAGRIILLFLQRTAGTPYTRALAAMHLDDMIMKRQVGHFLTVLLLALTIQVFGQETEPKFATAGEAEAYRVRQLFKTDYKKKNYERYKGKITQLDKTTYKFDTVTLRVFDIDEELLS